MKVTLALAPVVAGACLLTLAGCQAEAPTARPATSSLLPSPVAPAPLLVACTPDGISVAGSTVAVGQAGVPLQVKSTAAAGTYLNFSWTGGGGGDPAPTSATTWTLNAPPGTLQLSCSTPSRESPKKVVTVIDPDSYWRATTLADLGCADGALLDWAVGPSRGATAEASVANLLEQMRKLGAGRLKAPVTATRADIGYPGSTSETWLVLSAGHPYMTVVTTKDGSGFAAYANTVCRTPDDDRR